MYKRIALFAILLLIVSTTAHADTWDFDKAHSSIGFSVRHMVISKVNGSFTDFDGKVDFDGTNLDKASVEVTIKMASIDTDNEKRNDHLKNADFFDVEKYPAMTFKSKKIIKGTGDKFQIVGDLTIKDVTKEVTLDAEYNGTLQDPWGNTRAGFSAATTINRQDFNVTWDNKLQDGSLVVSNDVTISLNVELIKAK